MTADRPPPAARNPVSGGIALALCPIAGFVIGMARGQPSAGVVIGFAVGLAIAVAIWLRDRR